MSQYPYPDDEFDALSDDGPAPVGVHRAPVPASRAWLPLLAIIIIVPLLAWGAVAILGSRSGDRSGAEVGAEAGPTQASSAQPSAAAEPSAEQTEQTEQAEPTEEPTAEADLDTGVTIHNGTATNGLAARTSDRLIAEGYSAVMVSPGSYEEAEPADTTVYYAAEEHAGTAQAVAQALGVTNVVEDPEMAVSNPVVVVLRDDFVEDE